MAANASRSGSLNERLELRKRRSQKQSAGPHPRRVWSMSDQPSDNFRTRQHSAGRPRTNREQCARWGKSQIAWRSVHFPPYCQKNWDPINNREGKRFIMNELRRLLASSGRFQRSSRLRFRLFFSYTASVFNIPQSRDCNFTIRCKECGENVPAPVGHDSGYLDCRAVPTLWGEAKLPSI